ncbi:AraC family transcriptional regulator [Acetobacter sp. DmW_043]|nr:AraC family transcriptional regulator [Acetobacter sp. DmW_043]
MPEADLENHDPHKIPRAIAAVGVDLISRGFEQPMHAHRKGQIMLAIKGQITCHIDSGFWMVPPSCALWIPGEMHHSVHCSGNIELYILFVDEEVITNLPQNCCTFSVSPLLEELIAEVSRLPPLYDTAGADGRLVQTMIDQIVKAPVECLHLPTPSDPRLKQIAAGLMKNRADRRTIGQWARTLAMSERGLCRLVVAQTGMSFGRWRQQFHIMFAIERLIEGCPVQVIAHELGYESSSAFITMFKKALGQPPRQYLSSRRASAKIDR